jgi:hypothetical protein
VEEIIVQAAFGGSSYLKKQPALGRQIDRLGNKVY